MRIEEEILVRAPLEAVWERVGDPLRWPRDLGRMRCSHVAGTPDRGCGAHYWLHLEVGAAEVGSLIEVLEYEPNSALSWATVEGLEQRGHWRLRDRGGGCSAVSLSVSYQASGGVAALLTDEISSVWVRRYLRDSLRVLASRLQGAQSPQPAGGRRLLRRASGLLADGVRAANALAGARVARPARPDRAARALAALARLGPGTAGLWTAAAKLHPADAAIIDEQGVLTFAQLGERTDRLALALGDRGVEQGATVAIMCANHRGFVESLLACLKLGAQALLLDTDVGERELAEMIASERPRVVICDGEFAPRLGDGVRRRSVLIASAEPGERSRRRTLEALIAEADGSSRPPIRYERSVRILTAASSAPREPFRLSVPLAGVPWILGSISLRSRERLLLGAPLADRFPLALLSLAPLLASTLVLERSADAEEMLAAIERERVSFWATVPGMLQRVFELPRGMRRSYDVSSLRGVLVGGGEVPAALAERFMDEYGEVLYSVREAAGVPWSTVAQPSDLRRAPGSVGRPPRNTIVRVLDDDGACVPAGRTGRIFLAAETPAAGGQSDAFGGLVDTGQDGHLDDHGRLFIDAQRDG